MFVDQVKVFARAGKGGKGCVAFHREAYITKGGPSGGNGGRGGDVIIVADHDRNNLIEQYFKPRLLAEHGEAGMGKGMDGHAGEDLIIKVPCGTLIWKLPDTEAPIDTKSVKPKSEDDDEEESDEAEDEAPKPMKLATASRETIRYQGRERAIEVEYEDEEGHEKTSVTHANASIEGAELVADLTENGQQYILCKGGRGGLGNRNFATSVRQAPRFAQPGEVGGEGN
ncbi:MAG: GTPase ObgE, partial [Verrucomicrobiota bacterium]